MWCCSSIVEYYLSKKEPERDPRESEEQFNVQNAYLASSGCREQGSGVIAKQRHGPVGSINVHSEKRFTHFSDLKDDGHIPEVSRGERRDDHAPLAVWQGG